MHECLRRDDAESGQLPLLEFLKLCTDDSPTPKGYDLEELAARAVLNHFKFGMKMGQNPESVCTTKNPSQTHSCGGNYITNSRR